MQCLYCKKRLGLFASKKRPFCSDLHEVSYHDEQSGLALRRVMDPLFSAPLKPILVEEESVPAEGVSETGSLAGSFRPAPVSALRPDPAEFGLYLTQSRPNPIPPDSGGLLGFDRGAAPGTHAVPYDIPFEVEPSAAAAMVQLPSIEGRVLAFDPDSAFDPPTRDSATELPAGVEEEIEAAVDAGVDAEIGAGADAGVNAGVNAEIVAGADAGVDEEIVAAVDVGVDAEIVAGADAGADAGVNAEIVAGVKAEIVAQDQPISSYRLHPKLEQCKPEAAREIGAPDLAAAGVSPLNFEPAVALAGLRVNAESALNPTELRLEPGILEEYKPEAVAETAPPDLAAGVDLSPLSFELGAPHAGLRVNAESALSPTELRLEPRVPEEYKPEAVEGSGAPDLAAGMDLSPLNFEPATAQVGLRVNAESALNPTGLRSEPRVPEEYEAVEGRGSPDLSPLNFVPAAAEAGLRLNAEPALNPTELRSESGISEEYKPEAIAETGAPDPDAGADTSPLNFVPAAAQAGLRWNAEPALNPTELRSESGISEEYKPEAIAETGAPDPDAGAGTSPLTFAPSAPQAGFRVNAEPPVHPRALWPNSGMETAAETGIPDPSELSGLAISYEGSRRLLPHGSETPSEPRAFASGSPLSFVAASAEASLQMNAELPVSLNLAPRVSLAGFEPRALNPALPAAEDGDSSLASQLPLRYPLANLAIEREMFEPPAELLASRWSAAGLAPPEDLFHQPRGFQPQTLGPAEVDFQGSQRTLGIPGAPPRSEPPFAAAKLPPSLSLQLREPHRTERLRRPQAPPLLPSRLASSLSVRPFRIPFSGTGRAAMALPVSTGRTISWQEPAPSTLAYASLRATSGPVLSQTPSRTEMPFILATPPEISPARLRDNTPVEPSLRQPRTHKPQAPSALPEVSSTNVYLIPCSGTVTAAMTLSVHHGRALSWQEAAPSFLARASWFDSCGPALRRTLSRTELPFVLPTPSGISPARLRENMPAEPFLWQSLAHEPQAPPALPEVSSTNGHRLPFSGTAFSGTGMAAMTPAGRAPRSVFLAMPRQEPIPSAIALKTPVSHWRPEEPAPLQAPVPLESWGIKPARLKRLDPRQRSPKLRNPNKGIGQSLHFSVDFNRPLSLTPLNGAGTASSHASSYASRYTAVTPAALEFRIQEIRQAERRVQTFALPACTERLLPPVPHASIAPALHGQRRQGLRGFEVTDLQRFRAAAHIRFHEPELRNATPGDLPASAAELPWRGVRMPSEIRPGATPVPLRPSLQTPSVR